LNILVISYYFPPYEGVASRRWAKYTKYLTRIDHDVYVICNDFIGPSPWDGDVEKLEEKVTRIKTIENKKKRFQKSLPVEFVDKIMWKISYLWDKSFGKKTTLDSSKNCIPSFYNAAKEIIHEKSIDIVIASGGPYEYLALLPMLKKVANCKFVLDLRDPFPYEHNSDKLSKLENDFQKQLEHEIIDSVDGVISVYDTIIDKYNYKRGAVISHALDFEDFDFPKSNGKNSSALKFVFGGHPYSDSQYFELLNDFLGDIKEKRDAQADCYIPSNLVSKIDFESENINFYPYKSVVKDFLKEQCEADGVLYIVREKHEIDGNFTTKFYELIMTRKPILYFGPETKVSRFIEDHRLGFVVSKDNIPHIINEFLSNIESKKIPEYFDLTPYSFEKEVLKLLDTLKDIHAE